MDVLKGVIGLIALATAPAALATNGYFSHGYSISQKAMGGAGTALVEDGLIGTINPAGNVWADEGVDMLLSMFIPIRRYRSSERGEDAQNGIFSIAPGYRRSHNEYYPIPAVSYNRAWGERMSWGVSMYGNGGLNTEYIGNTAIFGEGLTGFEAECDGSFGGGEPIGQDNLGFCGNRSARTGVDLAVLFLAPNVSMKLGDRSSIGISPLLAMSRFAAQGLGAFAKFSNDPDKVTNNGHELSFGAGYRIGVLTGLIPGISLGASYQSKVWMDPFEDYRGLFAGQGDFDIPETWNVGLAVRITENQRLVFDYQRINYSGITSVNNRFDSDTFVNDCAIPRLFDMSGGEPQDSPACLGAATGPGFGWQDMEVYKFGYQYRFGGYAFRIGYSQTEQPIPDSEVLFNVLAPGVIEKHYTAGVSVRLSERFTLETSFMFAPDRPVTGKNPLSNTDANLLTLAGAGLGLDPLTGLLTGGAEGAFVADENDQDIKLNMQQYEITVGLGWRF